MIDKIPINYLSSLQCKLRYFSLGIIAARHSDSVIWQKVPSHDPLIDVTYIEDFIGSYLKPHCINITLCNHLIYCLLIVINFNTWRASRYDSRLLNCPLADPGVRNCRTGHFKVIHFALDH